jgi:hypothetical protein
MSRSSGYKWLRDIAHRDRNDLQRHLDWFREWQPEMRRRLERASLSRLSAEEFAEVLGKWDKERWRGVARLTGRLTGSGAWPRVRSALVIALDERRSVGERLDQLRPFKQPPMALHLGQAVITAGLHLRFPDRYCVWNGTSEAAMKLLGLWPVFPRSTAFADRYLAINASVRDCARATNISLPVLDVLWYYANQELGAPLKGTVEADHEGVEGGERVTVMRTKRNADIVRKAKVRWSEGGTKSPSCSVCGWSMDEVYGDAGFGLIEAHHNDPLGTEAAARITRISDLSPVCPSCHAVLHCSGLSMTALRRAVLKRGMARD